MTRWKAAGIHLSISLIIGIAAFCLLYFVYYPQPYFEPAGAGKLVMMLLGVDVILGPLLTLVVFKSGKKSLNFDLSVIATAQIAALVYGLHVMWVSRPVFIVAAVDRVELVYANDVDNVDLAQGVGPFGKRSTTGPVFVGVTPPTDANEVAALLDLSLAGKDIQRFPKYYIDWDQGVSLALAKKAIVVERLPLAAQALVKKFQKQNPALKIAVVPLSGRLHDYTMVLDAATGARLAVLNTSPW